MPNKPVRSGQPAAKPRGLSKSKVLQARQCPRRLWLSTHHPELADEGADQVMRLTAGTEFGALARDLMGGGTLVEHVDDLSRAQSLTRDLVDTAKAGTRLFEAAFSHEGVLVRVDAVERTRRGWVLTEIKSSGEVKDYHAEDVALQSWVLRKAGLDLRENRIGLVDKDFVYRTPGDYTGLLRAERVDELIEPLVEQVDDWVAAAREAMTGAMPDVSTGPHCVEPFACPFQQYCRSLEPPGPAYPVSSLPYPGKLVEALVAEGYSDLREVPLNRFGNAAKRRMVASIQSGRPIIEDALVTALASLPYPRYYLDFETINPVVPRWLGMRPFEQVPFQFSCHVERQSGEIEHHAFLDLSGDCPVTGFAEALVAACGKRGPIIVYNQGFEARCIRSLAEWVPSKASALLPLVDRMFDLLPLVRNHYYHPDLHGSFSIKAVLPTVVPELRYDQLDGVQHGTAAQLAYLEAIDPATPDVRREELRAQLLRYCGLDTEAMYRLLHGFLGALQTR